MIEVLLQADRLLTLGMLDQAEALYGQVAGADPRNAIAVVGLARVAVERGADGDAYMLARRALDIDPQNVAAFRLAARLEETIASRGEPLPAVPGPASVASLMPARGPAYPPPIPGRVAGDDTRAAAVDGETRVSAVEDDARTAAMDAPASPAGPPQQRPRTGKPGRLDRLLRRRTP